MVFSSIPFLYYFLPAVMLTYFLVPKTWKNAVLLVFSLLFYAWGEPRLVALMLFTIGVFYGCGYAMGMKQDQKWQKQWLIVSIVISIGLLAIYKYANFFIGSFNEATGLSVPLLKLALPVGISFYTFQSLSYTIDVYRGQVAVQKNPISFAAYVVLFPQLIAGPIVRYSDVARELDERTHSWEKFAQGLRRFLVGLGKKIIIADGFAILMKLTQGSGEPSVLLYWIYAISVTLNIYFDFSGYSDMAIGLGQIFGFHFPENFNFPYISKSISEFWRRWHMTLGGWFRDYIYIPLGGNRVSKWRWLFNILVVWMLTGLWHGAAWNFVLWGLLYAVLLLVEKWIPAIRKLPAVLKHIYVMLAVIIGFVLFNAETLSQAGKDIAAMFGFAKLPVATKAAWYYLRSYSGLLIAGILGATPLVRNIALRVEKTKVGAVVEPILCLALLLVCTAYLVDGSFSPFLYFRF